MSEIDRAFAPLHRLLGENVHLASGMYLAPSVSVSTLARVRATDVERQRMRRLWREEMREAGDGEREHAGDDWPDDEWDDHLYWREVYPDLVREASAFYVVDELCDVITHAADYLPETFVLHAEAVPTQFGVVVLGEPFEDAYGDVETIFWHLCPQGVIVSVAYKDDPGWELSGFLWTQRYGMRFDRLPPDLPLPNTGRPDHTYRSARWLASLWLFIVQRIPALEQRRARRQTRRHDLKDAPTLHTTTFVTLRRRETNSSDPRQTDIEWTHRWLVSGHWRNQFYPSTGEHSPIWIAPYVKGPDDLPLVPKDRAFVVSR